MFTNVVGREPLALPDIEINVGTQTKKRITAELSLTVQGLKDNLSAIHGIF
jgi:hypothetical protein